MQILAFLLLFIAGCGFGDLPEVEVRDAGLQGPQAAPSQAPIADPLASDSGVARQSEPRAGASPEMASPAAARQADSGTGAVASPTLDPGTPPAAESADGALPSPTNALSADRRCLPGTYQGRFDSLLLSDIPPPQTVSGTITLELATISGQDRLSVNGKLNGVLEDNGLLPEASPVVFEITAVLDCATHQLDDGLLLSSDGATQMIIGMLEGAYSDTLLSLSGTWTYGGLLFGATGDWSASAQTNATYAP